MNKELSERKKQILKTLVDIYITTGQPVSSSDVLSKSKLEVSSATIRSELSALEALGFIEQPHTSAGRIPLKPAYKLYVGSIENNENSLTDAETAFIRSEFSKKLGQVEDLSKKAAKVISDLTNYTTFCVEKNCNNIDIEEIKLVPLKQDKIVVIIVTNKGIIANNTIDVEKDIKNEYIETATRVLNKVFYGKNITELENYNMNIGDEIDDQIDDFKDILDNVLSIIKTYIKNHEDNVFVEGALKMLDYPEYNNVEDAKNFLQVISDKTSMNEIFNADEESIEFSVKIGKEDNGVDKCAIVTAAYKVGDEIMGQAGVIGPERMDYRKVIGVLEYMKKTMSTVINNSDDNDDNNKN